jgi:hypothetical protein
MNRWDNLSALPILMLVSVAATASVVTLLLAGVAWLAFAMSLQKTGGAA